MPRGQEQPQLVVPKGVDTSLPSELGHPGWSGHPLPAPSALLGCPYSVRLGGEESGFLLCPGPCSGSCELDIGAEATLDVPGGGISGGWDFWVLGRLKTKIAIPG